MAHPILIKVDSLTLEAELNETATAKNIYEALPIEGKVNRWGNEIYFKIQAKGDAHEAVRDKMAVGELAFWPPGNAFCIFWGPTPASENDEPRAASPVVPIGIVLGKVTSLQETTEGRTIRIEAKN